MIVLQALARVAVRLAGFIVRSHRAWWWADLKYVQRELGESGLARALSCLTGAPLLALFRLADRLYDSHTGIMLDAGLVAALTLSPLDLNVPPGFGAALLGGLLGGLIVASVAGVRAGLRPGLVGGLIATAIAGSLSGLSGLDAGVSVGIGSFDTALAYLLVFSLVLRFVVEVHLRSMRRTRSTRPD